MKRIALLIALAAPLSTAAFAQAPAAPAPKAPPTASATSAAKKTPAAASVTKYPSGVKPAPGIAKTAFALKYQDLKIGTGPVAEANKVYEVKYMGWRAADGVKFDASDDHRAPVMDKDGKPVMGADGKPKLSDPQPFTFPQGRGRLIPGFDQGFSGMKVGGKRRLFIPWQLAYGTREIPTRGADKPGIPAKSDLVFDIELVKMTDAPPAPMPGAMGAPGRPMPQRPGVPPPAPSATPAPSAPVTPPPAAAPAPSTAPAPSAPAPTPQPSTPPQHN
jgi:peptidylprolyl isomerase